MVVDSCALNTVHILYAVFYYQNRNSIPGYTLRALPLLRSLFSHGWAMLIKIYGRLLFSSPLLCTGQDLYHYPAERSSRRPSPRGQAAAWYVYSPSGAARSCRAGPVRPVGACSLLRCAGERARGCCSSSCCPSLGPGRPVGVEQALGQDGIGTASLIRGLAA